jgi:hypothetical protein
VQLTKPSQIFNNPQTSLPIRNRRIEIVLFPMLIHTKPLKVNVPSRAKLRLHRSRDVYGAFHVQLLDTTFHDCELERNDARHFNRTTEGDLAVALAEMQVAYRKLGTGNVHGQEDLGAAGEVLDIAVSTMLRATRDSSSTFLADLLFKGPGSGAGMYVLRLRRLSDSAVEVRVGRDEFAFALVPQFEDFLRGGAAEDAGVNEACETDAGNVAGAAEDAFKVPDGFCTVLYQPPLTSILST